MKFRYFMRDCSRIFRKRFYKFSAKLFGSDEISKTLKEILESNRALSASVNTMFALNSSKIPQQIKDDFLLQILATPGGGIRFISENCTQNLKGFLRLVRPVSSPSIVLRRFGGAYDGGYVMMIPPFLRDKLGGVSLDSINIESSVKNTAFTPPPPLLIA